MINPFRVTWDNRSDCTRICGEIFWMYYDLATSYGRIGHNIDYETIDYKHLLFAEAAPRVENDRDLNQLEFFAVLIREGALVALCCELYNLLCDEQRNRALSDFFDDCEKYPNLKNHPYSQALIKAARIVWAQPPDCTWELSPAGEALTNQMESIYRKYVVGFYERALSEASGPENPA
jgi:hypothetical protein